MATDGEILMEGLRMLGRDMGRKVNYVANFFGGYFTEQIFTTLNLLPLKVLDKYLSEQSSSVNSSGCELDSIEDMMEDDMVENFIGLGGVVGIAQDVASVGFSIAYLCGNNSRVAHVAAGIVATKVGLNVLSLAAQQVYSRVARKS